MFCNKNGETCNVHSSSDGQGKACFEDGICAKKNNTVGRVRKHAIITVQFGALVNTSSYGMVLEFHRIWTHRAFPEVVSHSPFSSFFFLIQRATYSFLRFMSESLHKDSTVSSPLRSRGVLTNVGPHAPCP